eukprot:COSAG01_NODE_178_length_22933_cov_18.398529_6_plen_186_part_00
MARTTHRLEKLAGLGGRSTVLQEVEASELSHHTFRFPHVASHPRPNPLQASHTPRRTTQVAHGRERGAPALYNVRVVALPQDGQLPGTQDLERQTERSFAVHTHSPRKTTRRGTARRMGNARRMGKRQVGCRGVRVRRGAGRRGGGESDCPRGVVHLAQGSLCVDGRVENALNALDRHPAACAIA